MQAALLLMLFIYGSCLEFKPPVKIGPDLTQYMSFDTFKTLNNKSYSSPAEEVYREGIFEDNRKKVNNNNDLFDKGKSSYKMELNSLSDMPPDELKKRLGLNLPGNEDETVPTQSRAASASLPSYVNWADGGCGTPVKDQGQCGSCWSFSAAGALEFYNCNRTGNPVTLSEQNLVDCSSAYGNKGCNGGWMEDAFRYVIDNKGIQTEETYPYKAAVQSCQYDAANRGGTDTSYRRVTGKDEAAMQEAVATKGPVTVAIDSSRPGFQYYSEGVYYDTTCSTNVNHGVLVVGYGTDNGNDYWIVKNSWGNDWGENGYIRMARNKNNHCGIASYVSYPIV